MFLVLEPINDNYIIIHTLQVFSRVNNKKQPDYRVRARHRALASGSAHVNIENVYRKCTSLK